MFSLQARQSGAFRHAGFLRYWLARFLASFSIQITSVAVGWQVYDLTNNPYDLGLIGLVQFLPAFLLVLVTGAVADRYNRKRIMTACIAGEGLCVVALLILAVAGTPPVSVILIVLALFGTFRAFFGPAQQSLMPNLVPKEDLAGAIAWSTTSWQIAMVVGPVAGGLLYGLSELAAYGCAVVLLLASALFSASIPPVIQMRMRQEKSGLETLAAGFSYIWKEKIVLGAVSFDLFAVLLGGATALLPVYARDILDVGPWGLGLLRAAPGIGAVIVAALLLRNPVRDHAGVIMFGSVALFGFFTVIFGASTLVWLSVLALGLMGGFDMVSVYIRETLIQVWTPDALRGRVNAVNQVFVGASNELGEFRAGSFAGLFGAVPAVIVGGMATVAVTVLWWMWFPQLRRARHLDGRV